MKKFNHTLFQEVTGDQKWLISKANLATCFHTKRGVMYTVSSYSICLSTKEIGLMLHEQNNNLSCELLFRILLFGWTLNF